MSESSIPQAEAAKRPKAFSNLSIFANRNFRAYWASNLLFFVGAQLLLVSNQWMVTELTGSRSAVGLLGFVQGLAVLALGPWGGALADKVARRNLLMVSRAAFAALLFTLSFLFYSDAISVPILVIASLLGGVFTAFTQAATQTYIFDIVGRERLSNAVALNATGSSLGQMGGPSLGGLLIAVFGVGATYLAGGSGYVIGLLALLFVRVPGKTARGGRSSLFQDVVEGLRYVRKDATVAWVLGLAPLTLFGGAMFALRPVFAREVLDVGSVGFGLLATSFGVGSLVASSLVGVFGLPKRRGITIIIAQIAWCIWMLLYSVNSWFPAAMAIEFCMAFGPQVWTATTQTVLQTQVPEEMRGRMVSLLFTAIQAFFVGQLLGGLVADLTSDRMALAILGAAPLPVYLYALLFAKPLHRI